MEGSREGSAGCLVHVDVHGECAMLWVCNVVVTEHGIYSLSCMQKLCNSAGSIWYVGSLSIELCCSQRTKNHHTFKCFQVKL